MLLWHRHSKSWLSRHLLSSELALHRLLLLLMLLRRHAHDTRRPTDLLHYAIVSLRLVGPNTRLSIRKLLLWCSLGLLLPLLIQTLALIIRRSRLKFTGLQDATLDAWLLRLGTCKL